MISGATEQIHFSSQSETPEEVKAKVCDETFFKWFKQKFKRELDRSNDPQEGDDMKEDQFNAIRDLAEKQLEATESLNSILAEKATVSETAETTAATSETTTSGDKNMLEKIDGIYTRLTEIENQLSKAIEGRPVTENRPVLVRVRMRFLCEVSQ